MDQAADQSLAAALLKLPPEARDKFLEGLSADEIKLIEADLQHLAPEGDIKFLQHQIIPEDSSGHLFTGGRGSGKTQGLAKNGVEHMKGPACDPRIEGGHRVLAVSPTAADAISALHYGPSGITALWPGTRLSQGSDGAHLVTPSGVRVRLIGAFGPEDVERARAAGNTCLVLCDELAAWKREEIWTNIDLGLRLGPHPRWIAATTPRNRPLFKKLNSDPAVTRTHATIFDNPYLSEETKAKWVAKYGGTRTGRQELDGELLEDVEGALWTFEMIEACQIPAVGELKRVVVGVDPSGSEDGDETGILAGGLDEQDRAVILEDASTNGTADKRFAAVCLLAYRWAAGKIVYEAQFSGDNYAFGIQQSWKNLAAQGLVRGPCPKIERTSARGSKYDRALALSGSYEQGRVKHLPGLGHLEDQQTTWEIDAGWSPDAIDAEGYLVRDLIGDRGGPVVLSGGLDLGAAALPGNDGAYFLGGSLSLAGEGLLHPALDRTFARSVSVDEGPRRDIEDALSDDGGPIVNWWEI